MSETICIIILLCTIIKIKNANFLHVCCFLIKGKNLLEQEDFKITKKYFCSKKTGIDLTNDPNRVLLLSTQNNALCTM